MPEKVNIFISHKSEDSTMAIQIKEILEGFDDDKNPIMEFFLSEQIPGGLNWYEWIRSKLKKSNLLILLFTDPALDWDWCLYEAGLFDRMDDISYHRIICLHNPETEPPDPLKHLQAYPANPNEMAKFITQLFTTTELTSLDEPIARLLNKFPDEIKKAAKRISQLITRRPIVSEWHTKYMFVHVKDPKKIQPDRIPPDAKVQSTEKTFELFDRPDGEWEWKDMEVKARMRDDQRWLDELAMAMKSVAQGDLPEYIQALFHPLRGSVMYRPILYRADKLADGSIKFKILFCEDVSWQVKEAPDNMRSLLTSLVMATRFRYELLQKYLDYDGNIVNGSPKEDICQQIKHVIYSIEAEASSRGMLDKLNLARAFADAKDRQAVNEMFDNWYNIRGQLFDELGQIKCDTAEQQLNQLSDMNTNYLMIAVKRFQSLLEEENSSLLN